MVRSTSWWPTRGINLVGDVEDTSEDDFDRIVSINLKGVFLALKSVLPFMRKQGRGTIVTVGSEQSLVGKPKSAVYAATKGAAAAAQSCHGTGLRILGHSRELCLSRHHRHPFLSSRRCGVRPPVRKKQRAADDVGGHRLRSAQDRGRSPGMSPH